MLEEDKQITFQSGIRILEGWVLMKLNYVKRLTIVRALVSCLCLVAIGGLPLNAEVFNNESGSSDFNDPLAWENDSHPGVSGGQARIGEVGIGGDTVAFENPSTVSLSADSLGPVNGLRVGQSADGNGTLNHSAGTLPTTDWSFVGVDGTDDNPSIGRYNLSGTAAFGSSGNTNLHIGLGGGAHPNKPNQGFVTVSDQASILANAVVVGSNDDNEGTLTQTGGTVTSDNWVNVGQETGAKGVYNLSGGSLNTGEMSVGQNGGATGAFNVSGTGIVNVTGGDENALRIGRDDGGIGSMTITGDQASINTTGFTVGGNIAATSSAEGTLTFVSSAGGVSPIIASADVRLNDGSVAGFGNLFVDFLTDPLPAGDVLLIDVGGILTGTFANLPQGAAVPNSGGRFIDYTYGDGNNIALVIPEPSTLMLCLVGLCAGLYRRRQVNS